MRGVSPNGEQIRQARLAMGLSQEQLAARADVDVKTIRKAEQGKRIDAQTLVSLSFALSVTVQSLIRTSESSEAEQPELRQIVERWLAAWEARDLDAVMSDYDPQAVLYLPGDPEIPYSGRFEGHQAIRRAYELAWSTTATMPLAPGGYSIVGSDSTLLLEAKQGVMLPDGRVSELSCMQVFRFAGERIIEHRVEYDTLALQRLIAVPLASAGDRQQP